MKTKTTRYHLEKVVESASVNNIDYVKEEVRSVLQSNKPYESKCDYLGYSILSIDNKIALLDEQLKELKEYKSKLKEAKAIVLEAGAKVFSEFGIDKIEGAGISSITLSRELMTKKCSLVVSNKEALINAGFYKVDLDEKAVLDAYADNEYKDLILQNATVRVEEIKTPSRLRVNKRKAA